MKFKYEGGGETGSGAGTYALLEEEAELQGFPRIGSVFSHEARILSLSKDKMVLAPPDDPRKVHKPTFEFARQNQTQSFSSRLAYSNSSPTRQLNPGSTSSPLRVAEI